MVPGPAKGLGPITPSGSTDVEWNPITVLTRNGPTSGSVRKLHFGSTFVGLAGKSFGWAERSSMRTE